MTAIQFLTFIDIEILVQLYVKEDMPIFSPQSISC